MQSATCVLLSRGKLDSESKNPRAPGSRENPFWRWVRHCLLGNITENEPREATGPRRRLAMACVSSVMGHPQKNNSKKTTNLGRNRFTRHAPCPETELASRVDGYVLEAPVSSAYRFARERFVVPLGSSEWHEPEPGANGRRHLCLSGIVNAAVRRDGRGSAAPASSAYRFAGERIVVPLGSSEWHEPEPGASGRWHLCLSGVVRRVKDAGEGHDR